MKIKFADRMGHFRASDIREILKVTADPEIISFAGGLPAPELFPIEELKTVTAEVLERCGREALQYSTTEGYLPLREKIAARTNAKFGTALEGGDILVMSGSQQALDYAGKVFLDDGDAVICESPTYLGAISAFLGYSPRFVEVATDDDGMDPRDLERVLRSEPRARIIYVIPDFQNPTGRTWSVERREAFMDVVRQFDVVVVEDNPYGELRFQGPIFPALKSMDTRGQVILQGTFSKVFCPGMRIAWIAASPEIMEKFVFVKQAGDLHTSTISQREIDAYLEAYDIEEHVEKLVALYRERCFVMLEAMEREFPPSVRFVRPDGGLFTWVELPEGINARDLLSRCLKEKVAFVPGGAFYPNGGHENTLRLNFSNMPPERIRDGIGLMGKVLRSYSL
ncbi:PLP-dependent aminotransferase family protein [Aminithiophilus ramosus]|uniref:PLP-dependent aminotransferase family protein n=2 Tax=Synergistales TaxID=649776 RepID=A0A9Q7AMG2_9BACT|nr:PLP-dependent aminotransferase family protein [Aminithiophilus ramosus]QTX32083.1 PLP-dependent aminotransferase family protein [Aminithiophilus ramosus]QVL35949.1 PLP-dependent aminotransferase family protein [Synergistota bacterium]